MKFLQISLFDLNHSLQSSQARLRIFQSASLYLQLLIFYLAEKKVDRVIFVVINSSVV